MNKNIKIHFIFWNFILIKIIIMLLNPQKCIILFFICFQVSGSSGSQPPQQCQLCHATFTNYYELDEHVKAHASQQQTVSGGIPTTNPILPVKPLEYHCTHCAKQSLKQVFASLPALEQHVTHMHTGKGMTLNILRTVFVSYWGLD